MMVSFKISLMAKWVEIGEGCEMPHFGQRVLIQFVQMENHGGPIMLTRIEVRSWAPIMEMN